MPQTRIATVKATGKRYVVQQIDFRTGKVHVWGEVTSYVRMRRKHDASKTFMRDAVDVVDVEDGELLSSSLFEQAREVYSADKGYRVAMRRVRR